MGLEVPSVLHHSRLDANPIPPKMVSIELMTDVDVAGVVPDEVIHTARLHSRMCSLCDHRDLNKVLWAGKPPDTLTHNGVALRTYAALTFMAVLAGDEYEVKVLDLTFYGMGEGQYSVGKMPKMFYDKTVEEIIQILAAQIITGKSQITTKSITYATVRR